MILFLAVIMKEPLLFIDKNLVNNFLKILFLTEQTVSAIGVKKLLKVFAILIRSLMYFSLFLIKDGWPLILCFIDTRNLIPIYVVLICLIFSLKKLLIYFPVFLSRSVDKSFL